MILIDDFVIDAAIVEEHKLEAEVTDYPIEDGSEATSGVRKLPREFTVEGIVSDTPSDLIESLRLIEDDSDSEPSESAFAKMEAIHEASEPVTVTSSKRTYDNMVMTSFVAPVDASTGAALRFTAIFKHVSIVTNNRVVVRVAVPRAARKRKRGAKPGQLKKLTFKDLATGEDVYEKEPGGPLYHADGTQYNQDELNAMNKAARDHEAQLNPEVPAGVDVIDANGNSIDYAGNPIEHPSAGYYNPDGTPANAYPPAGADDPVDGWWVNDEMPPGIDEGSPDDWRARDDALRAAQEAGGG